MSCASKPTVRQEKDKRGQEKIREDKKGQERIREDKTKRIREDKTDRIREDKKGYERIRWEKR